ncbi:MAG: PilZ domain-containing protein [Erythrobacter sp.]
MQTRQKPRKALNLPGRFFTGLGVPVDVTMSDISVGGCRFPVGEQQFAIGTPLQIFIAGTGPHRAAIRWVENGEAGVTFTTPLSEDLVDGMQVSHVPDASEESVPGDFDAMDDAKPRRFC